MLSPLGPGMDDLLIIGITGPKGAGRHSAVDFLTSVTPGFTKLNLSSFPRAYPETRRTGILACRRPSFGIGS